MKNKSVGSKKGKVASTTFAVSGLSSSGAASDLGKAEDAAHTSGDVGIMALAVRKDTASAVAADGDYIPLIVDGTGRLWINLGASAILPASLGTKAAAASLAVTLASDEAIATTLSSIATKLDTVITALGTANAHLAQIETNTTP